MSSRRFRNLVDNGIFVILRPRIAIRGKLSRGTVLDPIEESMLPCRYFGSMDPCLPAGRPAFAGMTEKASMREIFIIHQARFYGTIGIMSDNEIEIKNLLERNVEEVIDRAHLESALRSGKPLRVKLGIDPTSPDLHLGHAVVLRKLKEFQDLGHQIVLIIGDFTARIGDPTGRTIERKPLKPNEVEKNTKRFKEQASRIISFSSKNPAEIRYNSEWYKGMMLEKFMYEVMSLFSVQNLLTREDFKKRLEEGASIQLKEFIYPLLQAYDSAEVKADVEIGGTDQIFNLLKGRQVQPQFKQTEQDVLTVPLLEGLDGVRKMSKSLGNYIGLEDEPGDMFGKVMSLPDTLVEKYFMLCTNLNGVEIKELTKELGPRDLKARLGFEIVKLYHGEKAAREAQENFDKMFSKKEAPEDAPPLLVSPEMLTTGTVATLVNSSGVVKSNSEARRLIEQGAVEIGGKVIKDPNLQSEKLGLKDGDPVKIGKKHFFRIKI